MANVSNQSLIIRRILVAVDHSNHGEAALETAAFLAKITKAQIQGLYVQEEHWEKLSKRSSATYINALTGQSRLLDENHLTQHIGFIAKRLERKLKTLGQKHEIKQSWKSIKGQVIEEILKAGKEVDLITIGRRGTSMLQKKKLGSTAKAVIQRSEIPVLVLAEYSFIGRTTLVVYDATKESQKGLLLGLSIAEKNNTRLSVLAIKNQSADQTNRNRSLEEMIEQTKIPVSVSTLQEPTIGNFIHSVKRHRPGMLIIPKSQPLLKNGSSETVLNYLKCAVLFMC